NAYREDVPDPFRPEPVHQATNAESKWIAVACASILARSRYLEQTANLNRSLNRDAPRGAGDKTDLCAGELACRHGMAFVDSISKKHFKSREKVKELLDRKYS